MMVTVLIIVLTIAAVSCGYFLGVLGGGRAGAPRRLAPQHAGPPSPTPANSTVMDRTLVQGLIGAHDMSVSEAVRAHIEQVLLRAGVQRIDAAQGEQFNPGEQEAVALVRPEDPGQEQLVAAVIRPGWRSQDRVLRPPQVEVWSDRG